MELEQIINCETGEIVNVNKATQEVVEVIQEAVLTQPTQE